MFRIRVETEFDPYQHLALEHHYLYNDQAVDDIPVLIIYRNNPSVVFGNFQNPWLECNVAYCLKNKIELVRRFSGGGCVYHDLGNINFCLISPKSPNSRKLLTEHLLSFFKQHGIPVEEGQKSDLLLNSNKVSGSAFRETRTKTLHHCTLLFNSRLDILEQALNSPILRTTIVTKALPSRRASVTDLSLYHWRNCDEFIQAFVSFLGVIRFDEEIKSPVVSQAELLWKSREFIWEKTPEFILTQRELTLFIKAGAIQSISYKNQLYTHVNIPLPTSEDQLQSFSFFDEFYRDWLKRIGLVFN